MSPRTRVTNQQAHMRACVERARHRLHAAVCLSELGAPSSVIESADRLLARSLAEIDISPSDLFAMYPMYRIVQRVRDAQEATATSDAPPQDEPLHELD